MLTAFDISEQAGTDMLDYQQLVGLLEGYAKPRDRIGRLLAEGSLIRLRKGLYVLGERYRRAPVSRERLANLIYGPSCVSLEYALSLYGLIPERVANVTSVTTGQTRRFETPLGCFTYRNLSPVRYAPGIRWAGEGSERFLMAGPERRSSCRIPRRIRTCCRESSRFSKGTAARSAWTSAHPWMGHKHVYFNDH